MRKVHLDCVADDSICYFLSARSSNSAVSSGFMPTSVMRQMSSKVATSPLQDVQRSRPMPPDFMRGQMPLDAGARFALQQQYATMMAAMQAGNLLCFCHVTALSVAGLPMNAWRSPSVPVTMPSPSMRGVCYTPLFALNRRLQHPPCHPYSISSKWLSVWQCAEIRWRHTRLSASEFHSHRSVLRRCRSLHRPWCLQLSRPQQHRQRLFNKSLHQYWCCIIFSVLVRARLSNPAEST